VDVVPLLGSARPMVRGVVQHCLGLSLRRGGRATQRRKSDPASRAGASDRSRMARRAPRGLAKPRSFGLEISAISRSSLSRKSRTGKKANEDKATRENGGIVRLSGSAGNGLLRKDAL
jgi:hypothetical protein